MNEKEILATEVKNRDVVFGYFQVPTDFGNGKICVALKRPPRNSNQNEYSAAFSFCSPADNFSGKFARTRTLSQLANGSSRILKFNADTDSKKLREVFVQALKLAIETDKPNVSDHLPISDRKIAPRWLVEFPNIGINSIKFGASTKYRTEINDSVIFG
jgi:hypothetical protein